MEVASCSSIGSPLGNKYTGNKRICESALVRTGRVPASARGSEATQCIVERVSLDAPDEFTALEYLARRYGFARSERLKLNWIASRSGDPSLCASRHQVSGS
ncbi:uncharacterized [Tachysurus ichikawai]